MNSLEPAQPEDIELCCKIICSGREFQREQGFIQWTNDYPGYSDILDDIQRNTGYLFKLDGDTAGYLCVDFAGDSAYNRIEGTWQTEKPYAVIHRMALSPDYRNKGLASEVFTLAEQLCIQKGIMYIRIDTDFPNKRMQHILEKHDYMRCGVVHHRGCPRIAYDKLLEK